jgi:hypothetical protein
MNSYMKLIVPLILVGFFSARAGAGADAPATDASGAPIVWFDGKDKQHEETPEDKTAASTMDCCHGTDTAVDRAGAPKKHALASSGSTTNSSPDAK